MQVDTFLSFCQRFGHLLHGFLCERCCLPGIVGAGFLDVTDDLQKGLLDRVQFRYMQRLALRLQHMGRVICCVHIIFVGPALCQHQSAEGGQHLVLRGNPGCKQLVLIGGQQACQLAEPGMLQQLTHNRRIDLVRVEVSCSLHRQPQLTDFVMLAIRYVGVT